MSNFRSIVDRAATTAASSASAGPSSTTPAAAAATAAGVAAASWRGQRDLLPQRASTHATHALGPS